MRSAAFVTGATGCRGKVSCSTTTHGNSAIHTIHHRFTRTCGVMRLGPDGVPGGLKLEEIAELVEALCFVGEPIRGFLGLEELRALHALGGAELQRLALFGVRHAGDGAKVRVR